MAEKLDAFPEKVPLYERYKPLFDGNTWKVNPTEYGYEEMK